jgi:D-threo-aldose 1-dehydrogenase
VIVDSIPTRARGSTGISPTLVGIGTSALGSMPEAYGYSIEEDEAARALDELLDGPFTFIDTGNDYGDGRSEQRIGAALARGRGSGMTVATKVDRDKRSGVFDGSRVRRSTEESLGRLGVDRVPLLHLHDPEHIGFDASMAAGGPVEALVRLRDEGIAASIGVAGGSATLLRRFVETGVFDVVQTHNRFTLLDRTSDTLISVATERGLGVINAAPYGGGLLSDVTGQVDSYGYRPLADALRRARDAMRDACGRFGVPLAAAALQFSTRDPRIHTTIVGMSRPGRATSTRELLGVHVPDELWSELDALTPSRSEWRND